MSEVRGIVLAHAGLAEALVRAVERIAGPTPGLVPLSNEGKSPESVRRELEAALGSGEAIVFTDLSSGSCAFAGRLVARSSSRVAVVTGVNLPLLLDFAFHREMALGPLVERLVQKARASIEVSTPATPSARADRPVSG